MKTIQDIRDGIAEVQSQLDDDLVLRDAIRAVIRSIGVEVNRRRGSEHGSVL